MKKLLKYLFVIMLIVVSIYLAVIGFIIMGVMAFDSGETQVEKVIKKCK